MTKPTPRPRAKRQPSVVAIKAEALAALSLADVRGFADSAHASTRAAIEGYEAALAAAAQSPAGPRPVSQSQAAGLLLAWQPKMATQLDRLMAYLQDMIARAMAAGSSSGDGGAAESKPSPDIDAVEGKLTHTELCSIFGTDFGAAPGEVFAMLKFDQFASEVASTLQVHSWSETRIDVRLGPDQIRVRPQLAQVFIARTHDGDTSPLFPVPVEPDRQTFSAYIVRSIYGGAVGIRIDHILFSNVLVPDRDMRILSTEATANYGNVYAQAPSAGGPLLAQGVHVGMHAWGTGQTVVTYRVTMPLGITPPNVTDTNPPHDFWGTPKLIWVEGSQDWFYVP